MLSIIISTYKPNLLLQLTQNIAETIGNIDYEIIPINNPGLMGICEAYNKGAEQAVYENLLFVHEDVLFRTKDWGKTLINHLKEKETGVIGLAGSTYVPKTPIGWHLPNDKYNHLNIIQRLKSGFNIHAMKNAERKIKVYSLDGVFLAIQRKVFDEFKFDKTMKGFHGYDTDFSLRVSKKYNNYFVPDILLEHFSEGNADKKWFDSNIFVRKKVGNQFNSNKDMELEGNLYLTFLNQYYQLYPATLKNIIMVLQFMPFGLTKKRYFEIFTFFKIIIRYPKALYKA